MNKETMKDLLTLGYGIVIYAIIVSMMYEASDLLDVPECRVWHQNAGICEEYAKKPGQSVIQ